MHVLGTCLYSAGSQYGNLHQLSVTISRMTKCNKKYREGRGLEKNNGEWTEKVEFTKEEIPGFRASMQGYLLTYRMF